MISDLKEKGGLVWEDKAVMILPIEDYDLFKRGLMICGSPVVDKSYGVVDPPPSGFLGAAFA